MSLRGNASFPVASIDAIRLIRPCDTKARREDPSGTSPVTSINARRASGFALLAIFANCKVNLRMVSLLSTLSEIKRSACFFSLSVH